MVVLSNKWAQTLWDTFSAYTVAGVLIAYNVVTAFIIEAFISELRGITHTTQSEDQKRAVRLDAEYSSAIFLQRLFRSRQKPEHEGSNPEQLRRLIAKTDTKEDVWRAMYLESCAAPH